MTTNIKKSIVIALMGHVNHGKTALFDLLCKTSFLHQESSNITQNVRIECLNLPNKNRIMIFDTPGHEYFSHMRSYVADLVDIILLVVDCTQGLQQQTKEVLKYNHKPIILVITKIDKQRGPLDGLYNQIAQTGCISSKIGGDVDTVEISVKDDRGIQELIELLEVTAECNDKQLDITSTAQAYIVDVLVSKRGDYSALIQIKQGVLKLKDYFICGNVWGQVNKIINYSEEVSEANGNHIVLISGFKDCPQVANVLQVVDSKKTAIKMLKQINRQIKTNNDNQNSIEKHDKCIDIMLKADNLLNLTTMENILHKHNILYSSINKLQDNDLELLKQNPDIWLIVFGSVHPTIEHKLKKMQIKYIISDVIYDITSKLTINNTITKQVTLGTGKIIQLFNYKNNKVVIVGCRITNGYFETKQTITIMRNKQKINKGTIISMQQNKLKITKAPKDSEIAINIKLDQMDNFTYKLGDQIISHENSVENQSISLLQ